MFELSPGCWLPMTDVKLADYLKVLVTAALAAS